MFVRALQGSGTCSRCSLQIARRLGTRHVASQLPLRYSLQQRASSNATNNDDVTDAATPAKELQVNDEGVLTRIDMDSFATKIKKRSGMKHITVAQRKPLSKLDQREVKHRRKKNPAAKKTPAADPEPSNENDLSPGGVLIVMKRRPLSRKYIKRTTQDQIIQEVAARRAQATTAGQDSEVSSSSPPSTESDLKWAEVVRNINELRPITNGAPISLHSLYKLEGYLFEGFTITQLQRYIAENSPAPPVSEGTGDFEEKFKALPWMGGVDHSRNVPNVIEYDALRGYKDESHTKKQLTALLLIRECWQIDAAEVVDKMGQSYIMLPGEMMELLLMGKTSYLKQLSDQILNVEGESIEVFRGQNIIRITAHKLKAELTVSRLRNLLQNFRQEIISMRSLLDAPHDAKSLAKLASWTDSACNRLGAHTGTVIKRLQHSTGKQLLVSYLDLRQDQNHATRADIVKRSLLSTADFLDRIESKVVSSSSPVEELQGYSLDVGSNAPWLDREVQWRRWSQIVEKKPSTSISEPTPTTEQADRSSEEPPKTASVATQISQFTSVVLPNVEDAATEETASGQIWTKEPVTEMSAITGFVATEGIKGPTIAKRPTQTILETLSKFHSRHLFTTTSYNLTRLLRNAEFEGARVDKSTMAILRFEPSPWPLKRLSVAQNLPGLEMRFVAVDGEQKLKLQDILAIKSVQNLDVMFPERPIDMRFQQRQAWRLPWDEPQNQESLPQVTTFIEQSSPIAIGSPRHETPPGLLFPIPTHMHHAPKTKLSWLEYNYLFMGIEYHRSVSVDYMGHTLAYTSVQGGPMSGTRGEVRLLSRASASTNFAEAAQALLNALENPDVKTSGQFRIQTSSAKPTEQAAEEL